MINNMQNQIPENWQETTLGGTATLNYGEGLIEQNRNVGGVPVYGSSGITGYHNTPLVNEPGYIIGRKGSVGSIYYSPQPFFPIDTTYYVTKSDIKCDYFFFNYLLKTLRLNKLNSDSAVPGLNREIAYAQRVLLPTLPEQKEIATILSAFDDKIEINNKIVRILEEMTQTIFKEWFVKFKFPGHEKVKFIGSELGKIPDGWKVETLDIFCEVIYGKDLPVKDLQSSGNPVYGGNGIIGFSDKYLYDDPEIIIGCRGAYSGNIFKTKPKSYVTHNSLVLIRKNSVKLNYLFYALQKANVKSTITGSAQPQITATELNKLLLLKPVEKVSNLFDSMIEPIETKLLEVELENQKLAQMRDLFLPKLMKGEIRV